MHARKMSRRQRALKMVRDRQAFWAANQELTEVDGKPVDPVEKLKQAEAEDQYLGAKGIK